MKRSAVKFDDLLDAFEFVNIGQSFDNEAYLCLETGLFHYHSEFGELDEILPEDIADSARYISIPKKNDLDLGRGLALRFAELELTDAFEGVYDIFSRKGAYSRFKSLLERRGKLQKWHEYEESRKKEALRSWCEENGIEIHD
ncbi:MAG: UPF0158 family protein [Victivallaceae bacterium]|nr:UPF0158 family protein [Victivallaceae bacterium]